MDKERSSDSKRAYHKPRLRVYGDIRKLTETSATFGMRNDGGGQGYSKAKTG